MGQRVVNTHVNITAYTGKPHCSVVQDISLWLHYAASRSVYMHVPGPCKHCREGAGLVRRADGEWVSCAICFGGYL